MARLSDEARHLLDTTNRMARRMRHAIVTPEHLLLAMIEVPSPRAILQACDVRMDELARTLAEAARKAQPQTASTPLELRESAALLRVMERSLMIAQSARREATTADDMLVALLGETDCDATFCLQRQGVSLATVISAFGLAAPEAMAEQEEGQAQAARDTAATAALQSFTMDLRARARQGLIDPLSGREKEIAAVARVLCRRRKNNPLLVGEPGVGKTAIAEGLAWLIESGQAPQPLAESKMLAVDLSALVAGAKYRGDLEARVRALLAYASADRHVVLVIDDVHLMLSASPDAAAGTTGLAGLFKPALASGSVRVLGITTFKEYREIIERDAAMARRFQKIDVVEPTAEETLAVLQKLQPRLEGFHRVLYSHQALSAAVDLSGRHLSDRRWPDKAIDVLDDAAAQARVASATSASQDASPVCRIDVPQIEETIAALAGLPQHRMSQGDASRLAGLERALDSAVFGQQAAIAALVSALKVAHAGLAAPRRPQGSFLFAGPTGVGKTEIARSLSAALGVPLVRIDMSEYMEPHTVARLIGSPPGYVGYRQGGLLTEKIAQNPHCVLLLDEIEKAHPDIHNVLLQVMDDGTLTDAEGRRADCTNLVIIMTTNAGAAAAARRTVGFVGQDNSSDMLRAIEKVFAPEFRNRLDAIIPFAPLSKANILAVVDKFLRALQAQAVLKNVSLQVTPAARAFLAQCGFSPDMGARPMARVLHNHIKQPLAEMILFGPLQKGGTLLVDFQPEEKTPADASGQPSPTLKLTVVTQPEPELIALEQPAGQQAGRRDG